MSDIPEEICVGSVPEVRDEAALQDIHNHKITTSIKNTPERVLCRD